MHAQVTTLYLYRLSIKNHVYPVGIDHQNAVHIVQIKILQTNESIVILILLTIHVHVQRLDANVRIG